jgi:hypothetical protein
MAMLSEDDGNLRDLSDEELALAWDLWFDLAQTTNDADPPYSHGVFQLAPPPDSSTGVDTLTRDAAGHARPNGDPGAEARS